MLNGSDRRVAIFRGTASYSETAPFHPDQQFPECSLAREIGPPNPAYSGVRAAFQLLGLDSGNFGSAYWNPLGEIIRPGDRVVLKPNFIAHCQAARHHEWRHIITHPSILRAVLDYVFIALAGSGEVTIADGPQTDSDFEAIRERARLDAICAFYRTHDLKVHVLDLRAERWLQVGGVTASRLKLGGDPQGYARIDLNENSEFSDYRLSGRFYGADYDIADTARFHSNAQHSYIVSRTVLDADVLINLPKLKTHKKTGVTLSLKNLVGIIGHRNCLPHHTIGMPTVGGDEVPATNVRNRVQSVMVGAFRDSLMRSGGCGGRLARLAVRCGKHIFGSPSEVVRSGNWFGNDTAWRMTLDVNKALFYYSGSAAKRSKPLRCFTVIDGILGSQGNGPVAGDEKPAGVVVAGFNPVAVDTIAAEIMGFDHRNLALLEHGWNSRKHSLVDYEREQIECSSNIPGWSGTLDDIRQAEHLAFEPPIGWSGHIEKESPREVFAE